MTKILPGLANGYGNGRCIVGPRLGQRNFGVCGFHNGNQQSVILNRGTVTLRSEDEVKRALNIDSWRNLSKDKLLSFVAEMPNMDKETVLKAIEQFPHFKSLVTETMSSFEARYESAQKYNWKSQKKVHDAYESYRETLKRELEREHLSSEDRFRILDMLRESVVRESEKDTENKFFTFKLVTVAATVGIAAVGAAVAALGGKVGFGSDDNHS